LSERTEGAERLLIAERQSAEGIVGPGNREGEDRAHGELGTRPASESAGDGNPRPKRETASTMTGEEGPNGAEPEWVR
jgi:hypothetical protein